MCFLRSAYVPMSMLNYFIQINIFLQQCCLWYVWGPKLYFSILSSVWNLHFWPLKSVKWLYCLTELFSLYQAAAIGFCHKHIFIAKKKFMYPKTVFYTLNVATTATSKNHDIVADVINSTHILSPFVST